MKDKNKEVMLPGAGTGVQINTIDPAAVAAAETAKARIQSAYIMAYQKPRDGDQARSMILKACKRPLFAERVQYSKPVGGRKITGPTIRFAELALREWGNVLTDIQIIYEDETVRRSRVVIADLETNTTFTKEIVITKTVERKFAENREVLSSRMNTYGKKVYIVVATDEEVQNKEAAMISKAIRNEGLRLIPSDIIDEAIEVAKETLKNRDSSDPDAEKKKLLDAFSELNVQPKDITNYLGHPSEQISPMELEGLREMYTAIKDGEASWIDFVNAKNNTEPEQKGDKKTEIEPTQKKSPLASTIKNKITENGKETETTVNDLQTEILSNFDYMSENKINGYDKSIITENTLNQHLGVTDVYQCEDIEKLKNLSGYLNIIINGWKKQHGVVD